jgi:hypothetical protein
MDRSFETINDLPYLCLMLTRPLDSKSGKPLILEELGFSWQDGLIAKLVSSFTQWNFCIRTIEDKTELLWDKPPSSISTFNAHQFCRDCMTAIEQLKTGWYVTLIDDRCVEIKKEDDIHDRRHQLARNLLITELLHKFGLTMHVNSTPNGSLRIPKVFYDRFDEIFDFGLHGLVERAEKLVNSSQITKS